MAWVRERYANAEQVEVSVDQIAAVGGGGQSTAPIQFVIQGSEMDQLLTAANGMVAELSAIEGFVDVTTSDEGEKPEISMSLDRERAADLGVPVASVAQALRALVAGDPVGELESAGRTADIVVQLPEDLRGQIDGLGNLEVRAVTGQRIGLANIVRVDHGTAPSLITRLDRRRQVTVLANLDGLPLGEAQAKVRAAAERHVPPELSTKFIGMVEIMEESFGHMVFALGLAVVMVYMILAAQFNSFWQPIAIMISLPLSFVGAFGGLFLAGMTLNIFSMIGLIMLMGLVTKNAILLVDFTNHARDEGDTVFDALVSAGKIRLRPILMTTAAMIFGMLPVALAISEGGETRAPMAVAVIGGLITSTLLTLVVVPVVYLLFDRVVTSRLLLWVGRSVGGDDERSHS
jgi:HAE1 family hydrophobic/amphiphilic exporter-1